MIPFDIFQTISEAIAYQVGIIHEAVIDTQYANIGTYPLSFYLHDTLDVPRLARTDTDAEANLSEALDTHDHANSLPTIIASKYSGIISAMNADLKTQHDNINTYLQAAAGVVPPAGFNDVHRNFAYAWYQVTREHIHANNVYCGLNNWPALVGPPIRPVAQSIGAGNYIEGYNDFSQVNEFLVALLQTSMGHFLWGGPYTDGCRIGTGATSTQRYQIFAPAADPQANYGNANLRVIRVVDSGVNWTVDITYVPEGGGPVMVETLVLITGVAITQMVNVAVDITGIISNIAAADGAATDECRVEISDTVGAVAIVIRQ